MRHLDLRTTPSQVRQAIEAMLNAELSRLDKVIQETSVAYVVKPDEHTRAACLQAIGERDAVRRIASMFKF